MQMPKLIDSLFFQQDILCSLVQQLQNDYIEQKLAFDPQVLDALSSQKVVQSQPPKKIVIPYNSYLQSLFTQNNQQLIYNCTQKQHYKSNPAKITKNRNRQKFGECPSQSYFRRANVLRVFGWLDLEIMEGTAQVILYEDVSTNKEESLARLYVVEVMGGNCYKLVPSNIQLDDQSLYNTSILKGTSICAIHRHIKGEITQVLTYSQHNKNYTLFQCLPNSTCTIAPNYPNLHKFLVQQHCFLQQLTFLQKKLHNQSLTHPPKILFKPPTTPTQTYLRQPQHNLLPKTPLTHNEFKLVAQLLQHINKTLQLNLGDIQISHIQLSQQVIVPVIVSLGEIIDSTEQKFAYDIYLLAECILSGRNSIAMEDLESKDKLFRSLNQICNKADPHTIIGIFNNLKQ